MYHSLQQDLRHSNGISITYGTVSAPMNATPHDHDFDEIVIVLNGSAVQYINAERYPVSAGDVYVVKGESIHCFSDQHNFTVFNIGFQAWTLNEFSRLVAKTPGYAALFTFEPAYRRQSRFSQHLHLDISQLHTLKPLLNALKAAFETEANELVITALFMQITGFLCRSYDEASQKSAASHNPYSTLINYIGQNFTSTITLEQLSQHSGLSKNGIISIFNRLYHTTPIKYINTLRIYRAEELLRSTDLTITQIALECGFNDSNYFTRTFRSIKGMTPREFRNASHSLF